LNCRRTGSKFPADTGCLCDGTLATGGRALETRFSGKLKFQTVPSSKYSKPRYKNQPVNAV